MQTKRGGTASGSDHKRLKFLHHPALPLAGTPLRLSNAAPAAAWPGSDLYHGPTPWVANARVRPQHLITAKYPSNNTFQHIHSSHQMLYLPISRKSLAWSMFTSTTLSLGLGMGA
mgnify:CR=1 FL=1